MNQKFISVTVVLAVMLSSLACIPGDTAESPTSDAPSLITDTTSPPADTPTPEPISQWASDALASSQYGDPGWSALQAVGEPDTENCGDRETAWASAASGTVEQLDVYFDTLVFATEINIVQTYNPDQVVQVDLIDLDGEIVSLYTQEPQVVNDPCPYTLTIEMEQTEYLVQGVRITVDQSVLGLGWNEIDAVELIGVPGEGEAVRPVMEGPATPTPFPPPEGFAWRLGGESGIAADEFAALGGMDTDANDLVYVSDNTHGIWVFDADGNQVNLIVSNDLNNPTDVKVGPDGNLFVAAWGANQVFVFTPGGAKVTQWGEAGTGEGQFGDFSPQALAVDPDGTVYVLDDNLDEAGESITRVQKFSSDGTYLGEFPISDEYFAASGIDVGPDGNIYVVGFVGGYMLKFDTEGNQLAHLADTALDFTGPQSLNIDSQGNMYVAIWTPASVLKLDPMGNLVAQFGVAIENGGAPWPEGGFYMTISAAALLDGSRVFAADGSAEFAYITAFEFK
jgi:sugar lactone lactonase YvrE